jgi:D-serine deaminase-like pyridoxal phosphate-dependent protein
MHEGAASQVRRTGVVSKASLDTPALIVDLDAMDANIARVAAACRAHGVAWRPHLKGQKVPELAHRQIAAGAIGVTCAKLGEAEVMAAAGIRDILIANQIVGPAKIERLVALARRANVIVTVDSAENLEAISAAAIAHAVRPRVVIEVDIGMRRAGVAPGEAAVALARQAMNSPGVEFAGFEAWEGHAVAISDPVQKQRAVVTAVTSLTDTAAMCRSRGIPVKIVSCGGTGTYAISAALPGVTEIQAGGAIFGDVRSRDAFGLDFSPALTVLTTVTSRPTPYRIICDAGRKSLSNDYSAPEPLGVSSVRSLRLASEHAILELDEADETLRVGDKIELVVGYGDTTVHLHDEMHGVRDGQVEVVWTIAARGRSR